MSSRERTPLQHLRVIMESADQNKEQTFITLQVGQIFISGKLVSPTKYFAPPLEIQSEHPITAQNTDVIVLQDVTFFSTTDAFCKAEVWHCRLDAIDGFSLVTDELFSLLGKS